MPKASHFKTTRLSKLDTSVAFSHAPTHPGCIFLHITRNGTTKKVLMQPGDSLVLHSELTINGDHHQ